MAIQPLGFLATELGWVTTEMGRQPWLVYNLLRTAEGVSPDSSGKRHLVLEPFLSCIRPSGRAIFFTC